MKGTGARVGEREMEGEKEVEGFKVGA